MAQRQHFVLNKADQSAVVLIVGPGNKVPLVIEPDKPSPHYWKCPGGEHEDGESPAEMAAREVEEEVGLRLSPEDLILIATPLILGEHTKFHYLGFATSWDGLKSYGDEGEIVRLLDLAMLGRLNFLPIQARWWNAHRAELAAHGVNLPVLS